MTTTHTPGPWEIRKSHVYDVIYSRGGELIAFVSLKNPAEMNANLRLLSAAPDLLAALERLLAANYGLSPKDAAQARAACAKARGEV